MTAPAQPTHAQRLQAKGHPITLADGREIRVRFGMGALVAIEERFGSLKAVEEQLKSLDVNARVFGPILDLLMAGIIHTGITREELLNDELLDPEQLTEYAQAVGRAFAEAFPSISVGRGNEQATDEVASPGKTGSTSAPSPSAAPKKRSGS
jgi:hypothetical protein